LSGVTYVAAPQIADTYQGALVIGLLDSGLDPVKTLPWPTREIEPVPGRLVIFPSFVPHMTRPTGVDGRRISVSFDVEPQ
jgi:hypothetical protein